MTDHATPDALEVAAAIGQGLHAIADAIRNSAPKPVAYNTGEISLPAATDIADVVAMLAALPRLADVPER